jgi:hypothetical protein
MEAPVPYSNVLEAEPYVHNQAETSLWRQTRPHLDSYDSSQECSLEHLRDLYRLVEAEDQAIEGYVFDDSCLGVA